MKGLAQQIGRAPQPMHEPARGEALAVTEGREPQPRLIEGGLLEQRDPRDLYPTVSA